MKVFILFFLCFFAVSGRAQITLEHLYPINNNTAFGLVEVDSALWKYVSFNEQDSITLFNFDRSLDRIIVLPQPFTSDLVLIGKNIFSLDGINGYLLTDGSKIRVYDEYGKLLFSRDTCLLGSDAHYGVRGIGPVENSISGLMATSGGTKMIIWTPSGREVYSLPGKLPGCTTAARSDVNSSQILSEASIPSSAYPNPSSNRVRIAYELPAGVSHGEIILTSEDGREVKRYRVTNAFSDILIDNSELASGSYFYKVVTERGESESKRIVVMK